MTPTDYPWKALLADSIATAEALAAVLPVDSDAVARVIARYPMRINPYVLSLIQKRDGPLWRQAIPDLRELDDDLSVGPDPTQEAFQSPSPRVVHRYPDRVVFLVSDRCALYCRHCMRKRMVGRQRGVTEADIDAGIGYIRDCRAVREVILSGGDPFLLSDDRIGDILCRLRRISHVDVIRIHTRIPCVLPARVTGELAALLGGFHPLYVNIQFNHPDELTPEAEAACAQLADAGIALGSQTVLLKGINDDPATMMSLMRGLLKNRIRPYYLHHADPVAGTGHFRTGVDTGLAILRHLQGRISGMGIPRYMIDLPRGGGKVPVSPDYVRRERDGILLVRNYQDGLFDYPLPPKNN
jgi:lysine 2,3-aminomutase